MLFAAIAVFVAASAQETTPPTFRGATTQRYMAHLKAEVVKLAVAKEIAAESISPEIVVKLTIGKDGSVEKLLFLDITSEGKDFRNVDPATPATRELVTEAVGNLGAWTPAVENGQPVVFSWALQMSIPVRDIAKQLDKEPLLFMGKDPGESLHPWVAERMGKDNYFIAKGIGGVVWVRIYIEPDGRVSEVEVLETPNKKLSDEVVRVINKTKGKWTPRRVDGVPQRTVYEYGINTDVSDPQLRIVD